MLNPPSTFVLWILQQKSWISPFVQRQIINKPVGELHPRRDRTYHDTVPLGDSPLPRTPFKLLTGKQLRVITGAYVRHPRPARESSCPTGVFFLASYLKESRPVFQGDGEEKGQVGALLGGPAGLVRRRWPGSAARGKRGLRRRGQNGGLEQLPIIKISR